MGVVTPALTHLCPHWPIKGLAREQKGGDERGLSKVGRDPGGRTLSHPTPAAGQSPWGQHSSPPQWPGRGKVLSPVHGQSRLEDRHTWDRVGTGSDTWGGAEIHT